MEEHGDREDVPRGDRPISRRSLLSSGLKGAAGVAAVAAWSKPAIASTRIVAQVASPGPDVEGGGEGRNGETAGAGGSVGGGGLANTGSDIWAALLAAGASITAGSAAHYASRKKKRRRRRRSSTTTPPPEPEVL